MSREGKRAMHRVDARGMNRGRFETLAPAALIAIFTATVTSGCARPVVRVERPFAPASPIPAVATSSATTATLRSAVIQTSFVGHGSLEAKGEKTGKTRLALDRLAVTAATTGDVAETSVEHVFRNDADEVLEGTLRFPLPEGAILTGLAMEIDGKLMEGELVERDKARRAYEQIVDQMQDPALLEWENGQTFKLRVFPIEAKKTKRVVMRFVAPLHRTNDGLFFAFRPPTSESEISTERVSLTVDGRNVSTSSGTRAASGEVLVRVADGASADVVSETTKAGSFWLAHVRPRSVSASASSPETAEARAVGGASLSGQALIVLCDRSRSMLEARELQKKTLAMLLDKLGGRDRFTVITGDVRTRSFGAIRSAAPGEKTAALAFVDGVEPDGASDVGKLVSSASDAIKEARARGLEPVVVYLGDAAATWGETRAAEIERIAKESTSGATMHVVILGKSSDEQAARALAAGAHGRLLRPKTEVDAERAASEIIAARAQPRVEEVHLVGADGMDVPSSIPETVYDGDELCITLRAAKDAKAPGEIRLVGKRNGKDFSQTIPIASATPAGHVAQRWAKAKIEQLERDGDAHKEEIVETSLDHGVMSRYTSFLVLDSEEAYARYQIARKAKASADAEGRVSGRDLDGDGRAASVTPDHLQPGDPEVRIPAPQDAQSVVVVFPFGETKTATFEPDERSGDGRGFWVARFLVDQRTPDGTYEIVVRITHKDGRVEILKLPYVVDTMRPTFDVSVTPKKGGGFEIRAKQRLTAEEVEAQAPTRLGSIDQRRQRYAHILTDAKRVEVRTPDGQTLSLVHVRLGEFVGTWIPNGTVAAGTKLRLVAVDRALNENVIEVEAPR